jgi:hypothetical protein
MYPFGKQKIETIPSWLEEFTKEVIAKKTISDNRVMNRMAMSYAPSKVRRIEYVAQSSESQNYLTGLLEETLYRKGINCSYSKEGDWEILDNFKIRIEINNTDVHLEIKQADFNKLERVLQYYFEIRDINLYFYSVEQAKWIVDMKYEYQQNFLEAFVKIINCL